MDLGDCCQYENIIFDGLTSYLMEFRVALTDKEKEWALKASRFIKAETKRAGIGYKELAERLNEHGLEETEASISSKLQRGTFPVTFFLAVLAVLGIGTVAVEDL